MGCWLSTEQSITVISEKPRFKTEKIHKLKEDIIFKPKSIALNRYKISRKVLGSGGFGKVFKASSSIDPSLKFAIKAIDK